MLNSPILGIGGTTANEYVAHVDQTGGTDGTGITFQTAMTTLAGAIAKLPAIGGAVVIWPGADLDETVSLGINDSLIGMSSRQCRIVPSGAGAPVSLAAEYGGRIEGVTIKSSSDEACLNFTTAVASLRMVDVALIDEQDQGLTESLFSIEKDYDFDALPGLYCERCSFHMAAVGANITGSFQLRGGSAYHQNHVHMKDCVFNIQPSTGYDINALLWTEMAATFENCLFRVIANSITSDVRVVYPLGTSQYMFKNCIFAVEVVDPGASNFTNILDFSATNPGSICVLDNCVFSKSDGATTPIVEVNNSSGNTAVYVQNTNLTQYNDPNGKIKFADKILRIGRYA